MLYGYPVGAGTEHVLRLAHQSNIGHVAITPSGLQRWCNRDRYTHQVGAVFAGLCREIPFSQWARRNSSRLHPELGATSAKRWSSLLSMARRGVHRTHHHTMAVYCLVEGSHSAAAESIRCRLEPEPALLGTGGRAPASKRRITFRAHLASSLLKSPLCETTRNRRRKGTLVGRVLDVSL